MIEVNIVANHLLVSKIDIEYTSCSIFDSSVQGGQELRFEGRLQKCVVLVVHVNDYEIILEITGQIT